MEYPYFEVNPVAAQNSIIVWITDPHPWMCAELIMQVRGGEGAHI